MRKNKFKCANKNEVKKQKNVNVLDVVTSSYYYTVCTQLYVTAPGRKGFISVVSAPFQQYRICFYFRTIMNCNLKTIQPRAFAQNQHLRYM